MKTYWQEFGTLISDNGQPKFIAMIATPIFMIKDGLTIPWDGKYPLFPIDNQQQNQGQQNQQSQSNYNQSNNMDDEIPF